MRELPAPWPLEPDPFLGLEEIDAPAALDWVAGQNRRTRQAFADRADYARLYQRLVDAYQSPERIVSATRFGPWAYDFWQDDAHPLGIWRRAPWAAWLAGAPVWETLLDIDALAAADGQTWVVRDLSLLYPDGDRALVILSPDGADACIVREFDLSMRGFVAGGFSIDQPGKHEIGWIDRQSVYVGWDCGGAALTRSGYPREARCWQRGTALAEAPVIFSGVVADIAAGATYDPIERRHGAWRSTGFFDTESYWRDAGGAWHRYDVPAHVAVSYWRGWLLFKPRLPWLNDGVNVPAGALLAIREERFLAGARDTVTLFAPTGTRAFVGLDHTRNWLIVSCLNNVVAETILHQAQRDPHGAWQWQTRVLPGRAGVQASVSATAADIDDLALVYVSDYLNPDALFAIDLAAMPHAADAHQLPPWRELARLPAQFDGAGLVVEMHSAVAADGVRIPFSVIGRAATLHGAARPAPCLLYGYGGFEIALTPDYAVGPGLGWLERGGLYVVANIRGGGEFGPAWHQAAQGTKRQVAFGDFITVAEALIAAGLTSAPQLAIQGGSNGGLLVAACMVQRPALFGAVVCEVPLLDMARYHRLLAGASWMDEYGDPEDPAQAPALAAYSPYHNVRDARGAHGGTQYPPVLFLTSTRDDRVHPGHARKMVAKMQQLGHAQTWYLENTEGGHAGAVDARQSASLHALIYEFLWRTIGRGWN